MSDIDKKDDTKNPSEISHSGVESPLESKEVKGRAIRGVASLLTRQVIIRVLGFVGMIVLARILTPAEFGIFGIAHFIIIFFEQVSVLGLSTALLRKKEDVTEIELRTVFTIQQTIIVISAVIILISAPYIVEHYAMDLSYIWLVRVMAIALLIASLKTIPAMLLQRQLRHDLLSMSEVGEHIVYLACSIGLAYLGFGVWSLVIALILRGLTGIAILFSLSWWRPRLGFDRHVAKEVLRFGIPIQLANMAGLFSNAVVPVIVGSLLGVSAVGYANFARTMLDAVVYQPLILMGRVQLRVFGRFQDEPVKLINAVERSMFLGAAFTFLLCALLMALIDPLVEHVITHKWKPAVGLIYILGPGYLFYVLVQNQMQVLKALGDAKSPLISVLILIAFQLIALTLFSAELKLNAYAVGLTVGIILSTWFVNVRARRRLSVPILPNLLPPMISGVTSGLLAFAIARYIDGVTGMIVGAVSGTLVYIIVLAYFAGHRLAREVEDVIIAILKKSERSAALSAKMAKMLRWMQCKWL